MPSQTSAMDWLEGIDFDKATCAGGVQDPDRTSSEEATGSAQDPDRTSSDNEVFVVDAIHSTSHNKNLVLHINFRLLI